MNNTDKEPLKVVYEDSSLGVHGDIDGNEFHYIFSFSAGGLESIIKNGIEWLCRCPKPTFWRALTDNDRSNKFHIKSGSWLAADIFTECKDIKVFVDKIQQGIPCVSKNNKFESTVYADEVCVCFTYETATNPSTLVDIIYEVKKDGKIDVIARYHGKKNLPELPVFGVRFVMPMVADGYVYKGLRGETYPDRKADAEEGIYQIDDMSLTPYPVPEEGDMRMDTDWVEIYRNASLDSSRNDDAVQTLRIQKRENKFLFSCLPYTASEIETAMYHEELSSARRTVLCVYGAVRGIGGIDSCGKDAEESYRISGEKDIRYSFTIV